MASPLTPFRPTFQETPNFRSFTPSQRSIIESRYMKGDPTPEAWLKRVAKNIALAELLYHPDAEKWGLFHGVHYEKKDIYFDEKPGLTKSRVTTFHSHIFMAEDRENNFNQFINNAMKIYENIEEAKKLIDVHANEFFSLFSQFRFLPNSPTLLNAGRDLQQLSACYVLPVPDSIEGITYALQSQALIHKAGGGTGFSFEQVRPKGDPVQSTSGAASGAVAYIKVFDKMTDVVKQGGNRRGANMAILPYWHPEIKEFIRLKSRPGVLENFNISVAVDRHFMEAVKNNQTYELINPRTQQATGRVSAKEIFNSIVENTWKSGDPGLIFIDKINNSNSLPTPDLGKISATNPCGEQPLLPNEPCNLGSINLSSFVDLGSSVDQIPWIEIENTIQKAVRFLDNVIDVNNYPMPEIEIMAKGNRRIGLGVMGWAEFLTKLGIPYSSDEALSLASKLMNFINDKALYYSEKLAEQRGVFPNWEKSIYNKASTHFKGDHKTPRHAARTTIAPTGSIGLIAGLQGAGIEPYYGVLYTRFTQKALDQARRGETPSPSDMFQEINPLFEQISRQNNFFGLSSRELWEKIEKNNRSLKGINEIPEDIQKLFETAHEIPSEIHVKMQAAFQNHIDNAVSKTVNIAHESSSEEIAKIFWLAYESGCKGITVYRDRSKEQQVLSLSPDSTKIKRARDYSLGVSSEYFVIHTGHGPLNIHIDFDVEGPFRVSASLNQVGTEIAGMTTLTGSLVSEFLESGGSPQKLVHRLSQIKGDHSFGKGENRIESIPHAISIALKTHLKKHNQWTDADETSMDESTEDSMKSLELWRLNSNPSACPECLD